MRMSKGTTKLPEAISSCTMETCARTNPLPLAAAPQRQQGYRLPPFALRLGAHGVVEARVSRGVCDDQQFARLVEP